MALVSQGTPRCRPRTIPVMPLEATLMGAIQKLICESRAQTLVAWECPSDLVRVKDTAGRRMPLTSSQVRHNKCRQNQSAIYRVLLSCKQDPHPWLPLPHPPKAPRNEHQATTLALLPRFMKVSGPTTPILPPPWNRHKLAWGQTG